jgi:hypothetical protein
VTAFIAAGAGFLLAVLWFDLMFDVQARGDGADDEGALDSISRYYRRVTTEAQPMSSLIALIMALTLAALIAQLAGREAPGWASAVSLALAVVAIGTAAARTVPAARRLGRTRPGDSDRSRLARSILRDHRFSCIAIAALLTVQLAFCR